MAISARIKELEKEWDTERALEVNMPVVALIGLALAAFVNIWWLIFPTPSFCSFFSMLFRDGVLLYLYFASLVIEPRMR